MTIRILLVDDDARKREKVLTLVANLLALEEVSAVTATNAHDAAKSLKCATFDLMVLDLKIPRRADELPTADAGLHLLRSISRKSSDLRTPHHIVGLTAFEDLHAEQEHEFNERLWHLVRFDDSSDAWMAALGQKLVHIAETRLSPTIQGYKLDIGIITALHRIELESILALEGAWKVSPFTGDDSIYHLGTFKRDKVELRVVATAASEMGMPAASVAAMKLIDRFRPRYLLMAGIAAGTKGNFGDILVATHAWDYGSGKTRQVGVTSDFLPAPSQIQIHPLVKAKISLFQLDPSVLRRIQERWTGVPRPPGELGCLLGPVASGASVVESKELVERIRLHQRDVIGVEMETYGVYCAGKHCTEPRPIALSMKSVCDFGTPPKTDEYQRYAGFTSAQFLYEFALAHLAS